MRALSSPRCQGRAPRRQRWAKEPPNQNPKRHRVLRVGLNPEDCKKEGGREGACFYGGAPAS